SFADTYRDCPDLYSFPTRRSSDLSVKFSSNAAWENRRNVYSPDGTEVGLSGIALTTNEDFAMAIEPRDTANAFNTIKIVTPHNLDRKSTRLNSSHVKISYAVFCLK